MADCLTRLQPPAFNKVWSRLPCALRVVAFDLPTGVCNDVKKFLMPQQAPMYTKLIELGRERCIALSDPTQRHNWANESWDVVPMSRTCKNHFFQLLRLIPLTSNDQTRWGTVEYLKKCPEKSDLL